MRSFFRCLGGGFLRNLPLLAGGGILLLFSFIFGQRVLRYISYSLFIAYLLSCSFQAVYALSAKGAAVQGEKAAEERAPAAQDRKDRR
ncbi:MAG: hypothetical protein IJU52_01085 [Clostridia bacterium]|nr:hypothetical protein [Clostridia bacterium]